MAAYPELEMRFRRLGAIEEAIGMLHWDAAAMMPPGGAASRSEQLATLRVIAHQLLSATETGDAKGSLLSTSELVENATGAPLGTAAFERHLRQRYLAA